MWTTCYKCKGNGFIIQNKQKSNCPLCIFDTATEWNSILIGQIWTDDTYDPITPPQSPRI